MIVFKNCFDGFYWFESTFGNPILLGKDLLIPARYLYILNHPIGEYGSVATGMSRFQNVTYSSRKVTEYAGDPKKGKFKETVFVDDGPFQLTGKDICEKGYLITGRIDEPLSCVDEWIIKAESFEFGCEGVFDLEVFPGRCEYFNYRTIEEAVNGSLPWKD